MVIYLWHGHLFIYDTSICLLPGWMVVWWLTRGLVLIGKVRYKCSAAEGQEKTKPATTWHEDPPNRHTLKQAVKSNWASRTSADPTFFTKRHGTLLPTGHSEYRTFLLVSIVRITVRITIPGEKTSVVLFARHVTPHILSPDRSGVCRRAPPRRICGR